MKILIDINHPAHVHVFKNFAWAMQERGHEIIFTTLKKEVSVDLLKAYKFQFHIFGKNRKGLLKKLFQMFLYDLKLLLLSYKEHINLFVSHGSVYSSVVAFLLKKPHIAFEDTEHAKLNNSISHFLSTVILTPKSYINDLGEKQIRYNGNLELSYLHPNYFRNSLDVDQINKENQYAIIRFVSWGATHDKGVIGLSFSQKEKLINFLREKYTVFVSSEDKDQSFKEYMLNIAPEKFHDFLSECSLYIGEGGTIASECAILGVPNIYINPLKIGYYDEEVNHYALGYKFNGNFEDLINKINEFSSLETKKIFRANKMKFLKNKIDVTAFMIWFVENYPQSFKIMKENPAFQERFK